MDLRQIRYFVSVAESKSFSAAAETLHVSQPALGVQIKNLEEELGTPLLRRHSRGVELTAAGAVYLVAAKDILARVDAARNLVTHLRIDISGPVSVGLTPTAGRILAPELSVLCAQRYPKIALSIRQGVVDPLVSDLRDNPLVLELKNNRLDMMVSIAAPMDAEHESIPVCRHEFYLIGRPDVLDNVPDPIRFSDLIGLPLALDSRNLGFRKNLDKIAVERGMSFSDLVEIDSINIRRTVVLNNRRCAIVAYGLFLDELRDGRLIARHIDDPGMVATVYLSCRKADYINPAELAVRGILTELIDRQVESGEARWLSI